MAMDEMRRDWTSMQWQNTLEACTSLPELTAFMASLPAMRDQEREHGFADEALCQAIRLLARWMNQEGEAQALIDAYDAIEKWYA